MFTHFPGNWLFSGDSKIDGLKYYNGGYTTQSTGSRYDASSLLDAVQIEAPGEIRWDSDLRGPYAEALGKSIVKFVRKYYPNIQ